MTTIMLDSIHATASHIPVTTKKVAGYVTGSADIQWTPADWARFPRAAHVKIDQSPDGKLFASGAANVLDIEQGAASIADAVTAVPLRHKAGRYSTLYVAQGNLAQLQAELHKTGVPANRIGYWVADWSLNLAEAISHLGNEIVAVQWASPSSNPSTIVPGGSATLKAANIDISVTLDGWFPPPPPPVPWQQQVLSDAQALMKGMQEIITILQQHQ